MAMTKTCALQDCPNQFPVPSNTRRKQEYCCNAHRQKAYRLRKQPVPKRNDQIVTIKSISQLDTMLGDLPVDQLHSLQSKIESLIKLRTSQKVDEPFLYFRKGKGIIHLAVNRNVTICGRATNKMNEVQPSGQDRICQRCSQVRERGMWWKGWRQTFDDSEL